MKPRVRFAPSPTGYLHVGGARTALFNWLFARKLGGTFVLRIEDTDTERSSAEMVTGILDGMAWLGIDWDEGPGVGGPHAPYFQSERLGRHAELVNQLVRTGHAYPCFCDKQDLEYRKTKAEEAGDRGWKYDRQCRKMTNEEADRLLQAGAPHAVRFAVPDGVTRFKDEVHGDIEFPNAQIEDFVIMRSDGHPLYHLSVVADDMDMRITHVVRGDDHISNTPKHVMLFEALGAPVPIFAHVPMIMGPDKKRLSKRHGATSVLEYAEQGYSPQAMLNFLAMLGWGPGTDQEIFSKEELIEAFSLDRIVGGNAIFNQEKLDWFNFQHVSKMSNADIAAEMELHVPDNDKMGDIIELLRPRAKKLLDFVTMAPYLFSDDYDKDEKALAKHLGTEEQRQLVHKFAEAIGKLDSLGGLEFEKENLEILGREFAKANGVKFGALAQPTRVALTGRDASPGLFEIMEILGREKTVARMMKV